jgi:hypothetical protein
MSELRDWPHGRDVQIPGPIFDMYVGQGEVWFRLTDDEWMWLRADWYGMPWHFERGYERPLHKVKPLLSAVADEIRPAIRALIEEARQEAV